MEDFDFKAKVERASLSLGYETRDEHIDKLISEGAEADDAFLIACAGELWGKYSKENP